MDKPSFPCNSEQKLQKMSFESYYRRHDHGNLETLRRRIFLCTGTGEVIFSSYFEWEKLFMPTSRKTARNRARNHDEFSCI